MLLQWGSVGETSVFENRVASHDSANFCTFKRQFISEKCKQLRLGIVDELTIIRLLASYYLLEKTTSGLAWSSASNTMHLPLRALKG